MFITFEAFLEWIEKQRRFSPKVSLEKMKKMCEILGNPQKKLKFIHIGGTNGKGSTVSYVTNILQCAGYNVGAFISPYVVEFNERISYNGEYISNQDVVLHANKILLAYPEFTTQNIEPPTFFEFLTLLSFSYFASLREIDVVVLEVGLGGLLDSTNIITPMVSAITNVSYDHMKVLGNTLEEIATNKLGIAKEGIPLVSIKDHNLADVFLRETNKRNAKLIWVDPKDIVFHSNDLNGVMFDYLTYHHIKVSLLGAHQAENAALAITIVEQLPDTFLISKENIYQGLYQTKWPGRLEVIQKNPVVLLDGAHNIGGITRLAAFLDIIKKEFRIILVFAVSQDKEKNEMIHTIEPFADEIIFSSFQYKRSDDAHQLYLLSNHLNKRTEENLEAIIEEIQNTQEQEKTIYVFCGSLFFISEVRQRIKT